MNKKSKKEEVKAEETKEVVNEEAVLLKNQLARTLADYENLKRRTEDEKISWAKFSSLSIVSKLLPIMDMLEKGQEHLKDAGLAIAIGEFKKVFIEEGLVEVSPKVNDVFDENLMEAIEVVNGTSNNTISELLVPGWKFKDGSVIRHAKVKAFKIQEAKKPLDK